MEKNSLLSLIEITDLSPRKIGEHECFRLLWIKVILRASYDWVLYRDSKSKNLQRIAFDAHRWLFEPIRDRKIIKIKGREIETFREEFNSLYRLCEALDIEIDCVRKFAATLTRDKVRKLEFFDRTSKKKKKAMDDNDI